MKEYKATKSFKDPELAENKGLTGFCQIGL